jgi:hypothetical protein
MSERLLSGPLAPAPDRLGAAAVVEQRVHRLLEHPLLVPEDDLRRLVLDQLGEPVVPVDHPPIQVVQVGRGEAPAVERHQRPQVGRNHRDDVQDHPRRVVRQSPDSPEERNASTILSRLSICFLRCWLVSVATPGRSSSASFLTSIRPRQLADRRRADVGRKPLSPSSFAFWRRVRYSSSSEELVRLDLLLARLDDDVARVVDHPLEVTQGDVDQVPHRRRQRLEEPDVRHGTLSSMWPMRSRRTLLSVTSTPHGRR